jgi:hypothetical protein
MANKYSLQCLQILSSFPRLYFRQEFYEYGWEFEVSQETFRMGSEHLADWKR